MPMLSLISLLALSACFTRIDLYDYAGGGKPTISASPLIAAVGGFIEVSVQATYGVDERSRIEAEQSFRTEIGICASKEGEFRADIACPFSVYPDAALPGPLILEMQNEPTIVRDATLQRGESITITHTVRLTATEPSTFMLMGAYLFGSERGWSSPLIDSDEVVIVTFR